MYWGELYPPSFDLYSRIPGGYYISFMQCLFTNDIHYNNTPNSVLRGYDASDLRFSTFVKTKETFYEKYQFRFEKNPVLFHKTISNVVGLFQRNDLWVKFIRNEFCKIIEPTEQNPLIKLYDTNCTNYETFNDFIKTIEDDDNNQVELQNPFGPKIHSKLLSFPYYREIIMFMIQTIQKNYTTIEDINMSQNDLEDILLKVENIDKEDYSICYQK
jgi:hypothetical protein